MEVVSCRDMLVYQYYATSLLSCLPVCKLLQAFKNCMQSPELTLCGKDVNLLLGQVDSVDTVNYRRLAPEVYDLLAARIAVCFSS